MISPGSWLLAGNCLLLVLVVATAVQLGFLLASEFRSQPTNKTGSGFWAWFCLLIAWGCHGHVFGEIDVEESEKPEISGHEVELLKMVIRLNAWHREHPAQSMAEIFRIAHADSLAFYGFAAPPGVRLTLAGDPGAASAPQGLGTGWQYLLSLAGQPKFTHEYVSNRGVAISTQMPEEYRGHSDKLEEEANARTAE